MGSETISSSTPCGFRRGEDPLEEGVTLLRALLGVNVGDKLGVKIDVVLMLDAVVAVVDLEMTVRAGKWEGSFLAGLKTSGFACFVDNDCLFDVEGEGEDVLGGLGFASFELLRLVRVSGILSTAAATRSAIELPPSTFKTGISTSTSFRNQERISTATNESTPCSTRATDSSTASSSAI